MENNIINKALICSTNKIKCHIILIPFGFKNGFIVSNLVDNTFFWFVDDKKPNIKLRLFLFEIFDIIDYKERKGG